MLSFLKKLSDEPKMEAVELSLIHPTALSLLQIFHDDGKEAYLVGGCVRDLIMGKQPHDWDITTSARPEETAAIAEKYGFKSVEGLGRRFGTVIVVAHGESFEITTYRSETYGQDAHRPEEISFSDHVEEDLKRRDFTVNALILDYKGEVQDFFGGLEDIKKKRLRTVGNPTQRFAEDALRLFRACRFLGQLDFMAERELVEAMPSAFSRVQGLSLERVREELDKLIVSPHAARGFDLLVRSGLADQSCKMKKDGEETLVPILPELSHLVDLPQEKAFHKYDGWYHTLAVLEASKPLLVNRWAALLHDVGKGLPGVRAIRNGRYTDYGHDKVGAKMAEEICLRHQRPENFTHHVVFLVEKHMQFHGYANTNSDAKKWIRKLAMQKEFATSKELAEVMEELTDLCIADIIGCGRPLSATKGHEEFGRYMVDIARSMPISTKELNYSKETIEVLKPFIKEGLANMLLRVQNGNLKNHAQSLYKAAVAYRRRREDEAGKS